MSTLNTTCSDPHTHSERERAQSQVATLQGEKESLTSKVGELEGEVKKLRRELDEETEKATEVDHTQYLLAHTQTWYDSECCLKLLCRLT